VVIPRGYAEQRKRGKQGQTAVLQALVDGGDSNRAIVSRGPSQSEIRSVSHPTT
jgi:hypothetical protein